MREYRQSYLVRMSAGQERFLVAPLRGTHTPRAWRFFFGVVVIDESLSNALKRATRMLKRTS